MRKKKQTPATIAAEISRFIKKQEDTLSRYPVGPMANAAKLNLQKGMKALNALKAKNEEMRLGKEAQTPAMNYGGSTVPKYGDGGDTITDDQSLLVDMFMKDYNYSPSAALAAIAVTHKESGGKLSQQEKSYKNTSNKRIKEVFEKTGLFKNMSDSEITKLKADDQKFFDFVYARDSLGNTEPGDGYKYRGRGANQLTGKSQYAAASEKIFGDDRLVKNPDLVSTDPKIGAQVLGWYYEGQGTPLSKYGIDVTQDLTEEQAKSLMTSTYKKTAGDGPDVTYDPSDTLFTENMPKMQEWYNSAQSEYTPSETSAQAETSTTPVEDTTPFEMLSPEAQAERVASEQPNTASPSGPRAKTPEELQKSIGEDIEVLNFDRVPFSGNNSGKTDAGSIYAENIYGDYNVRNKDGNTYVVKKGEFDLANPEKSISSATARGGSGIPYETSVDLRTTSQMLDIGLGSNMSDIDIGYADGGNRPGFFDPSFGHSQRIGFTNIAGHYGEGVASGAGRGFEDVVMRIAEERGITEPETERRLIPGSQIGGVAPGSSMRYETVPKDPQARRLYERKIEEITAEVAANPGTTKWTDEKGGSHIGVGGYTPFSDYLSYATEDSEIQSGAQLAASTQSLGGSLLMPGGRAVKGAKGATGAAVTGRELVKSTMGEWRRTAVKGGTQNVGKTPRTIIIGEDGARSFNWNTSKPQTSLLGSSQRAIPEVASAANPNVKQIGTSGNIVAGGKPGRGFTFKPGTAAAGQPVTFQATASSGFTPKVAGAAKFTGYGPKAKEYLASQQTRNALGQFGGNRLVLPNQAPLNNLGAGQGVFTGIGAGQSRNALGQFAGKTGGVLRPGQTLIPGGGVMGTGRGFTPQVTGLQRYAQPGGLSVRNANTGLARQSGAVGRPSTYFGGSQPLPFSGGTMDVPHSVLTPKFFGNRPVSTFGNAFGINNGLATGLANAALLPDFDARQFPNERRAVQREPGMSEEEYQEALAQEELAQGETGGQGDGDTGTDGEGTGGTQGASGAEYEDGEVADPAAPEQIPDFKTPLSIVPLAANMKATRDMRKAIENMQAPASPSTTVIPKFNYQSNIGQSLQDNRDAARAVMQSSPATASGMSNQQAALAQRFKQDARLRSSDNLMRQRAQAQYENLATQARSANNALRNQYNNDVTQFNNQKEILLGTNSAQGARNVGSFAQDYIQNVLSPQYVAKIQAMGRPYDAATMLPNQMQGLEEEKTNN